MNTKESKNLDDREREKKNKILESPLLKRLVNSGNIGMKNCDKRKLERSNRENKTKKSTKSSFEEKIYEKESSSSEDSDHEEPPKKKVKEEMNNFLEEGTNSNTTKSQSSSDVNDIKASQRNSLLKKVNAIIQSCVKLKEENKVTGSKLEKANQIIKKAEEKKSKLENEKRDDNKKNGVGEEETENLKNKDDKGPKKGNRNQDELEEGEITDDDDDNDSNPQMGFQVQRQGLEEKSKSSGIDDPQTMSGQGKWEMIRKSKSRGFSPISESRSSSFGSKSRSPDFKCYHHHQYRQRSESRSESPPRQRQSQWIPVTPCSIQEDVKVESMSTMMVPIKAKGEFSFKDNPGCMVKITKWTGKDCVSNIHVRPQIVVLTDSSSVMIEVGNSYQDRAITLHKHDKIACLSILSAPTPSRMFSSLSCSPDRLQTGERRWFKVTTVVLHKKGSLDRITIQPGKTLKVIGTVIGPLKKHTGKLV